MKCPRCGHLWGAYEDTCHCNDGVCHNSGPCRAALTPPLDAPAGAARQPGRDEPLPLSALAAAIDGELRRHETCVADIDHYSGDQRSTYIIGFHRGLHWVQSLLEKSGASPASASAKRE